MDKHTWKVVTTHRHWSAARKNPNPTCEACNQHASWTSHLRDDEGNAHDIHWHCEEHADKFVGALEAERRVGFRVVVSPRHWMHIWKVGHKRCVNCSNDSRYVVSLLDPNGHHVHADLYCSIHAPVRTESTQAPESDDVTDSVRFELGGSWSL